MNRDRYNAEDTPETEWENECLKTTKREMEMERGDWLRDQQIDKEMEEERNSQ
jgi:hypothetical protein